MTLEALRSALATYTGPEVSPLVPETLPGSQDIPRAACWYDGSNPPEPCHTVYRRTIGSVVIQGRISTARNTFSVEEVRRKLFAADAYAVLAARWSCRG